MFIKKLGSSIVVGLNNENFCFYFMRYSFWYDIWFKKKGNIKSLKMERKIL